MKTFNRLVREIGPRIKSDDLASINYAIARSFKNHFAYIKNMTNEEYNTFVFSILLRNNGLSNQIDELLQTKKIWFYLVLSNKIGEGTKDCDDCKGQGEVDCPVCGGDANVTCYNCDERGNIDCDECDGSGEIDGNTCEHCDGDGELMCTNCSGEGEVDCDECSTGTIECEECDGDGSINLRGFGRYIYWVYVTTDDSEILRVQSAVENGDWYNFKTDRSVLISSDDITIPELDSNDKGTLYYAEKVNLEDWLIDYNRPRYQNGRLMSNEFPLVNTIFDKLFDVWYD
jgi:hypothetical protein